MARSVNKVTLIGNLGNNPEMRATSMGKQVANISLATTSSWNDRNTGELQERTEWHRIVLFDRLAEIAGQYLKKGSRVYLEGTLRTRSWEQEGQKKYSTEILGRELMMLDTRIDSVTGGASSDGNLSSNEFAQRDEVTRVSSPPENSLVADDDIPF